MVFLSQMLMLRHVIELKLPQFIKLAEYYEERGFHVVDRQKDNCG